MRIDSHQHFWAYAPKDYPWMSERLAALRRDYLPQDLAPLLAVAGFEGCVAVQARQTLEETAWLLELSEKHSFIRGVVGWVDLLSREVKEQLASFAEHPRLVGVRHVVQDEPDDRFVVGSEFKRGIAALQEFGLKYDLLIYPRQLPAAIELVREFPEQPFVLDHIAKPGIRDGAFETWARDFRRLAEFPNVWCKLSGMVTEANWKEWQQDDFTPYMDVAFDSFGAERLMIGSDWPVCTLSGDYEEVVNIVKHYAKKLPLEVQEAILGGNCSRFYDLQP